MKIKIEFEDDGANACDRFIRAVEKLVGEFNKIKYPKTEQNDENTNSSEH